MMYLFPRIAAEDGFGTLQPLMGRGVAPVLRRGDEAALDRVIVDVVDLLIHHLITVDFLRVRAFLPDLMAAFGFVLPAKIIEFAEEPGVVFRL